MILGKGNKYLQNGKYEAALEKALKAKSLDLEEHFEWLCHSIEGKARYQLGEKEEALLAFRKAEEVLAPMLEREHSSEHLPKFMSDITSYIEKIERGDT